DVDAFEAADEDVASAVRKLLLGFHRLRSAGKPLLGLRELVAELLFRAKDGLELVLDAFGRDAQPLGHRAQPLLDLREMLDCRRAGDRLDAPDAAGDRAVAQDAEILHLMRVLDVRAAAQLQAEGALLLVPAFRADPDEARHLAVILTHQS